MYENKTYITMQDLMEQMGISDKTVHRMIDDNELPGFTYGSRTSRKKGWHAAILERHAMERYEHSTSFKNVSNAGKIVTEDMSVVPLGNSDRTMAQENRNFDNRNISKEKPGRKKVSEHVRPSTRKSRVSAGFAYPSR